jgi:hypothetical protein
MAMDDSDRVNPREAVAGLGLLGAMMVALVGTFVYRFVSEPGGGPAPPPDATVAIDSLSPGDRPEAASARLLEPASLPKPSTSAASEPSAAPAIISPEITPLAVDPPTKSESAPITAEPTDAPPFESSQPGQGAVAAPAADEAPRFVAPGSRPNQ